MEIKIPKTFMGKPVAGSLERVLAGLNTNPQNPQPQTSPLVNAPNLDGYIFVPSIGLYVAKQRTHLGLNWNQTHEELQKENLRMPTIPQFLEYLKFLQNGYSDRNEAEIILDDILKTGDYRGEWLDAKFTKPGADLFYNYEHYEHVLRKGLTTNCKCDKLEPCLKEDCWADIFGSANSQGLPTQKLGNNYEQGKNAYFWYPRENRVARFAANSDRANLYCDGIPTDAISSLGVFACAEGVAPKS